MNDEFNDELKKFDLSSIQSNPEGFAKKTTIANGIKFIKLANHFYYGTGEPIVSDSVYDKIEEILKERSPNNKVWKEIRNAADGEKEKVKLPYWMGSMDKIKPGKEQVEKWSIKYPGEYVISEKLDGMSFLMTVKFDGLSKNEIKLYTRGDGIYGQDITSLLKYVKYPKQINNLMKDYGEQLFAFRGELIISRNKYDEKYKTIKTDPRSMVAGLMNSKYADPEELKDLDLVVYEVLYPEMMKPSLQFEYLTKIGFKTPRFEVLKTKKLDDSILMKMLPEWKKESNYEIDGLIITQNQSHIRNTDGNPDYSRAFKMDLDEQRGIGEVEEILWEVSRHGKIVPRIKIKPIKIGLVTIQKATAFNAKYIKDHNLGPGAIVNIIRSGDVIPYIESVVKGAPNGPSMPEVKYNWHPGGYDIYIDKDDKKSDDEGDGGDEIEIKQLIYFMTTLEADGISSSTIKRYYEAGYKSIKDILNMTEEDLLGLPNTQEKLAKKQFKVLQEIKHGKHPLDKLMAASGVFGLGFGAKKAKMVIDVYPDILTRKVTKVSIVDINGFESKTADLFIKGLSKFKTWLEENGLKYLVPSDDNTESGGHKLSGMTIVMTGFRDKELEKLIEIEGGSNTNSVSSKTSILLAKDVNELGGKLEKARSLKVPIMTAEDFKKKYNL